MKLWYFDGYGRGEAIRLLLNHAGVQFEDARLKWAEWSEIKHDREKFPYGQLPVLEKDGKFYPQSGAILRMLGREHGYYPTDPEEIYGVENNLELLNDFTTPIGKVVFGTKDEEEK